MSEKTDVITNDMVCHEYSFNTKWNPFNSFKLLTHVERWGRIVEGRRIPPPLLVTVDPANICNLHCAWCNAEQVIRDRSTLISREALHRVADLLANWRSDGDRVEAVCVAGGGEPLLNPHVGEFIQKLIGSGLEVGVTTNGMLLDRFTESLLNCSWVSVSVDAASAQTFGRVKKTLPGAFDKVIRNMADLVAAAKPTGTLGRGNPYQGLCYKFLVCRENLHEMLTAAKLASSIGCRSISFRPMGRTWIQQKAEEQEEALFTEAELSLMHEQLRACKTLESDQFHVYSIVSRFGLGLAASNEFKHCYAVFMTAYITPPAPDRHPDGFTFSLCCDRRGDPTMELLPEARTLHDVEEAWGSPLHWSLAHAIPPKSCPRCTFKPHNEIFEQVILADNMSRSFI